MSQIERLLHPGGSGVEAASAAVSDAYFPHELSPRDAGGNALDDVAVTVLGLLRIARIGWGAEVAIHSDHPGAYGINVPLGESWKPASPGPRWFPPSGLATINPPDTPAEITRWSSTCTGSSGSRSTVTSCSARPAG